MKSSSTSSWKSTLSRQFSSAYEKEEEAMVTTSTRELVEFYWTNRKRFSGGYIGFPSKINEGGENVNWSENPYKNSFAKNLYSNQIQIIKLFSIIRCFI